jgi:hypothetical protein
MTLVNALWGIVSMQPFNRMHHPLKIIGYEKTAEQVRWSKEAIMIPKEMLQTHMTGTPILPTSRHVESSVDLKQELTDPSCTYTSSGTLSCPWRITAISYLPG